MRKQKFEKLVLSLFAGSTVFCANLSLAQDNSLTLEEVVVTSQKREQSLQDVPISVVAFDTEALETKGIDDLKDIGPSIPNLYINPFNNDPTAIRLFVRGIGQNDVQITQDPSVALYLDGVYIGSSFGSGFEGVDIERLEVLRGPQGTLYGRNATGGALNIITQRASVEGVALRQDITGGNLGKFASKTTINVPLGEKFAAKLNYLHSERDGYVENNGPGEDFGLEDRRSVILDLRLAATDNLTIDYRYEDAKLRDSQRLEQIRELDPTGAIASFTTINADVSTDRLDDVTSFRQIRNNSQDITAHTLLAEWAISDTLTFKSITAWRELDGLTNGDALSTATGDYTAIGGGVGAPNVGTFSTLFEQTSQEFQLIGSSDSLEYAAGLYYYLDESTQDATQGTSIGVSGEADITETDNESIAVFAQATWTPDVIDQRLHLTLGLRYSEDDREAARLNNRATVPFTGEYKNDFANFNPSVTVGFDLNDVMNIYGKVVTGYKSGGTSTRSTNAELFSAGFEEEDILSYEFGFKGDFLNSRARLNAAMFYMEIDGLQTSIQTDPINPGGRDFLPVDGNEIAGAELDLNVLLAEGLTFTFGYGYLDTTLGQESVTAPNDVVFNLSEVFSYAPESSYNLGLDYQLPLANGVMGFNVNYAWQDEVSTSVNAPDETFVDSYGLLGVAVSWSDINIGSLPGSFRLLLWGKNLADEEYGLINTASWTAFGASDVQTFGDPRTAGLTLTYKY